MVQTNEGTGYVIDEVDLSLKVSDAATITSPQVT